MADAELDQAVRAALAGPAARIRRLDLADGRRFWLKQVERLSVRLRLQKGNPARALAAERLGLKMLADADLPVAPVVMDGPGWMVLGDVGRPLPVVVADPATAPDDALRAFAAAGRSLGLLHGAGLVHGRPAARDICWDGADARFIDLERFSPGRRGRMWQALDVVMFVQTCFTRWPDDTRWLEAALDAYRDTAPSGAMARVARVVFWLGWLSPLARVARRLRPGSKELRAVPLTLARLRG